jgi:hypothetical protein
MAKKEKKPKVKKLKAWTVTRRELRGKPGEPKVEFVWRKATYGVMKKVAQAFMDELNTLMR